MSTSATTSRQRWARHVIVAAVLSLLAALGGTAPAHAAPSFSGTLYSKAVNLHGKTFTVTVHDDDAITGYRRAATSVCGTAVNGPGSSTCLRFLAAVSTDGDRRLVLRAQDAGSILGDTIAAGDTLNLDGANATVPGTGDVSVRERVALGQSDISFERGFTASNAPYYRITMPSTASDHDRTHTTKTVIKGTVSDAVWNDVLYITDQIRAAKADQDAGIAELNWGAGFLALQSVAATVVAAGSFVAGAATVTIAATGIGAIIAAVAVGFFFFKAYSQKSIDFAADVSRAVARYEETFGELPHDRL